MALSRQAIETLLDLVDNRIDAFHIQDMDDALELDGLERTRAELRALLGVRDNRHRSADIVPLFPQAAPGY